MSIDRFTILRRGALAGLVILGSVVAAQSCGFPDKNFISDDEFYGRTKGGKGNQAGSGGADASVGAGGGAGMGTGMGTGMGGTESAGGRDGAGGVVTVVKDSGPMMVVREAGPGGSTGTGGQIGTEPDGGDAGPVCAPGLSLCSGTCTDLQTDKAHCGKCETACTGTNLCTSGTCSPPCGTGLTACKPTGQTTEICVDTTSDAFHCGKCNQVCPTGTVCESSSCVIDCGSLTRCGSQCFDTTKDNTHCGNCSTNCTAMGQVCAASVCKTSCSPPLTACGNTCVNTSSDDQNCNGCGKPCGASQGCVAGVCKNLIEDCQNGSDDDRDGKIDCADPDCQTGFVCAGTPSGWTGPVALWTGATGAAPTCSAAGSYPANLLAAHDNLTTPGYTCPACSCKPSSGAGVTSKDFYLDQTAICDPMALAWTLTVTPSGGACSPFNVLQAKPSVHSAQLKGSPTVAGSCVGGQPAPQFPNPSWSTDVLACGNPATSGGGCSVGQCLAKPKAPFGTQLCIFRAGIASCPSDYPVQRPAGARQYYETWLEGRSCSVCSCGTPFAGGTLHMFTDPSCRFDDTIVALDGSCTTLPLDPTQSGGSTDTRAWRWDNAGAACGNPVSQLSGAPQPDSPVTVCCQSP